jgi:hypothetical protein
MLGTRAGNADDINLLESVVADQLGGDLSGKYNQRYRVHIRRSNSGNRVCRSRAGRHQANAGFAAGARITVGSMHGPLLVPDQYVSDICFGKLIEKINNHAARKPEDRFHTFVFKHFHHYLSAASLHFCASFLNLIRMGRTRPEYRCPLKKKSATSLGADNGLLIFNLLG